MATLQMGSAPTRALFAGPSARYMIVKLAFLHSVIIRGIFMYLGLGRVRPASTLESEAKEGTWIEEIQQPQLYFGVYEELRSKSDI